MAAANAQPATVVFFSVTEFGARPVADQVALKEGLEQALETALAPVPPAERIVVDTRDGAAVVLLAHPASALDLGDRARAAAPELPFSIGINHGPVKLAPSGAHGPALIGDALAAGAAVAGFAKPGAALASRSFRDVLAESDPSRAKSLQSAGTFTDAAVRAHEVFAPGHHAGASRRRRGLILATLGIVGILAAGVAVHGARERALAKARTTALVALAITPGGEVLVDGAVRGMTPPLKSLELAPGRHTIVVRTGAHAPLTTLVDLAPGQRFTLRHDFPPPPTARAEVPEPKPTPAPAPKRSTTATTPKQNVPQGRDFKRDMQQAGREMRDFFRGLVR
jgi:hypothetical protein